MTLNIGTKVKWGWDDMRWDGTIRGMSDWDNKTYYVIEDDQGKFYPRPKEWVAEVPETTLPEYVAAYILHEIEDLNTRNASHITMRMLPENLEAWVTNAFEAYEER